MKYVSLDLETTCVERKNPNNIIGFSFVVEDSNVRGIPVDYLPHCTGLIDQQWWEGNAFALQMNAKYLKMIANRKYTHLKPYHIYDKKDWVPAVLEFLKLHLIR